MVLGVCTEDSVAYVLVEAIHRINPKVRINVEQRKDSSSCQSGWLRYVEEGMMMDGLGRKSKYVIAADGGNNAAR